MKNLRIARRKINLISYDIISFYDIKKKDYYCIYIWIYYSLKEIREKEINQIKTA